MSDEIDELLCHAKAIKYIIRVCVFMCSVYTQCCTEYARL